MKGENLLMGCWNETCMVSHLPIMYREKCAMVVLLKQKYPGVGCYATDEYASLAVIRGEYNDYGCLENYDPAEASALLSALSAIGLKVSECGVMKDYIATNLEDFFEKSDNGLYSTCSALSGMSSGNNSFLRIKTVFVKESMLNLAKSSDEERRTLDKAFSHENGRMRMRNVSVSMGCGTLNTVCSTFLKNFREFGAETAYQSTEKVLGLNRLLNRLRMTWHIPSGKGSQSEVTEEMILFGHAYMQEISDIKSLCGD